MKKKSASTEVTTAPPLYSLKDLRRAWRTHQEAVAAARQAEASRPAPPSDVDFKAKVGPVAPVKAAARALVATPRAAPVPRQRLQDERAVMQEALSDGMDAEQWLQTDVDMSYARPGLGPDVLRKLSRGHWSVQGEIDLHGLRVDEARSGVAEFLRLAMTRRWRCVRIVHGKGLGSPQGLPVLKNKVKRWLQQREEVLAFAQAPIQLGGAGALLVLLKS